MIEDGGMVADEGRIVGWGSVVVNAGNAWTA